MSVEYLHCCDRYIDLDYNCEEVVYYKGEAHCWEHVLDDLQNNFNLTEEQAEKLIDDSHPEIDCFRCSHCKTWALGKDREMLIDTEYCTACWRVYCRALEVCDDNYSPEERLAFIDGAMSTRMKFTN